MATRLEKILSCIDVSTQVGLEIGALMNPIVTPEMGNIRYIDYATTEELKLKYQDDPNVDIDKIVKVDYVWGENTLPELVSKDNRFDYLVASHVIEHVPNFIGWLKEIHAVLKPGGILSLVIPDKRYCFDYYRQVTTTAEVLDAFLRNSRKPSPKQIYDSLVLFTTLDGKHHWDSSVDTENGKFEFKHSETNIWGAIRNAFQNEEYIDSHCWVFTPQSFFQVLKSLINLDLFDFTVERFYPTNGCEFYVSLKSLNLEENSASARRNIQLESLESVAIIPESDYLNQLLSQTKKLKQELAFAERRIEAMESSKFWKLRQQWFLLKKILKLPVNE
jgi:predicted SAM-dependent methyltransferase